MLAILVNRAAYFEVVVPKVAIFVLTEVRPGLFGRYSQIGH